VNYMIKIFKILMIKWVLKIKRENKSSLFAPNLTMNLTYLCSGDVKVYEWVRH